MGHFFPSYTFDLDNTLYLFTSGRYEYRNKGMDLYIEALARLNWQLKQMTRSADGGGVHHHQNARCGASITAAHRSQSMFEDLRNTCSELQEQMGLSRLFRRGNREAALAGGEPAARRARRFR